jgi:hypothetical protein
MTRDRREHFRGSSSREEESGADEDIVRSMRNLTILQTLPGSQGEMHIPYHIGTITRNRIICKPTFCQTIPSYRRFLNILA